MGNKNNKYLVQGGLLAMSSIIVRLIGLLYRVPLQRIIGDGGMAFYSAAFEIYNLALILSSYSIPIAVSKLVSAREKKKEYNNANKVFKAAMILAVTVGGIASLIIFFGAEFFAKMLGFESAAIPLRILAPTIFVFSIMGVLRGFFQGKNTMMPTAISQVFEQIVNAIVSIVAAYGLMKAHNASDNIEAWGAAGGTTGTLFGAIAGLVFLAFIYMVYRPVLKKRLLKDESKHEESLADVFKILVITVVPIILSQTVYQLSGTVDSAMFGQIMQSKGYLESEYDFMYGIYSGKYRQLTNLPVALATALGAAIVPALAATYLERDMENLRDKIATSIKFNMLLSIPAAVGLGVLAEPILTLLFKGDTKLSVQLLQLGCVAVVFFALSTLTNGILQGIDKMHLPVIHSAISLAIHVVLLFVLLKVMDLGAYGLVIGNVTFALVVSMLNWISIAKYAHYKQEIRRTFILPTVASIIMGIVAYIVYHTTHGIVHSNLLSILVTIPIAVIVYGVAVIMLKAVTKNELLAMPMGSKIVHILKKIHIL